MTEVLEGGSLAKIYVSRERINQGHPPIVVDRGPQIRYFTSVTISGRSVLHYEPRRLPAAVWIETEADLECH